MNRPTVETGSTPDAPRRRHWPIMAALVLAEIVSSFEGSMVYAALAEFYRLYHDPVAIGWLLTGFMLVASISAAICGRLGDMYGRRRVLMIALALAGVGSLISAATDHLGWIIAGRSIQGFAGAILPLCYGLVREHFPATRIAVNIGIISATASGGAGVGVILGGLLVDHGSWRLIFLASAALAMAAVAAVAFLVPAGARRETEPLDWIGAVLFIVGAGLVLYAVGAGASAGWGSPFQLSLLGGGFIILAAWAAHEWRTPSPMIDLRMMVDRQVGLTLLIFAMISVGALNISQIVLVMLQQPTSTAVGLGISATAAGVVHAPASVLGVIASPLVGWVAGRRGGRSGMIAATSIIAASWVGLFAMHGSVAIVMIWMLLNGFGMGALMAAAPNLIVEVAPSHRTSEATGLAQIVRKIAMACGAQLIAVSLASSTVAVGVGAYPDAGAYSLTYGWIAALNIAAVLLSLCLPRRKEGVGEKALAAVH